MIENSDNIEATIFKFFSGSASSEEIARVDLWLKENCEHEKMFMQLKNIWDISNPPFNIEEIDVQRAYANIETQLLFDKKNINPVRPQRSFIYYWQRVAAILLIPLLFLSIYLLFTPNKVEYATVYQEVFAPYGTRSMINLPDSSKVWLNAGSSLKYPIRFTDKERRVSLSGEAYFEVKSDKKNPFIVKTGKMEIQATGTAFNVESYKNDSMTAITLVSGVVNIKVDDTDTPMSPGEKIDYNRISSKYQISETDTYKWCSWKDGILAFRNDPLEYVFKRLGQTYNINFVIKEKSLTQYVYHATFEGESLDEIMHLLEVSAPIRYRKIGDRKDSNNYYHKQTIEVYKSY